MILTKTQRNILQAARDKYGATKQIGVSIEELCELSAALSKFGRYDHEHDAINHTRQTVLDEYTDVIIVLEHIREIFSFTDAEVAFTSLGKTERLERWLKTAGSLEVSMSDRAVPVMGLEESGDDVAGV